MDFSNFPVSVRGAALKVYQLVAAGQGLACGEYGGMIDRGNNLSIIPCFYLGDSVINRCAAAAD